MRFVPKRTQDGAFMTLGEAIHTLKELRSVIGFYDYPTIEQISLMRQILKIIEGLEVPELVGKDEYLHSIQQHNN